MPGKSSGLGHRLPIRAKFEQSWHTGPKISTSGAKKKKSKQVYSRLKEKLPKLVGMGVGEEEKCVLVLLMMVILLHNFG